MNDVPVATRTLAPRTARRIAWLAVVFLVALLVVLCGWAWFGGRSPARWRRVMAEIRARGEPTSIAELEQYLGPAQASGTVAATIARYLNELNTIRWHKNDIKAAVGSHRLGYRLQRGVSNPTKYVALTMAVRYQDVLVELWELPGRPPGRYQITWETNPRSTAFYHWWAAQSAGKLLDIDIILHLLDRRYDAAKQSTLAQFAIARSLDCDPFLRGHFIGLGIDAAACTSVENLLTATELAPADLERLEREVVRAQDGLRLRTALLGSRAVDFEVCDGLATGVIPRSAFDDFDGSNPLPRVLPAFMVRANQVRIAELYTGLLDAGSDAAALQAACARIRAQVTNTDPRQAVVALLMDHLESRADCFVWFHAPLRCTQAALAAERYRLDTGAFPASLNDLVPIYLAQVPTDPFDGQPLRLATTDEGITIYAIGQDMLDDGGTLETVEQESRPRDVGFRLLRPERRGIVILDTKAEAGDPP